MIARIATALVLAGLSSAGLLGQPEVTHVNSPIETRWGLSDLDYRPVEGGIDITCTIEHHGAPATTMELDLSLLDEAGSVIAADRVVKLSGELSERIDHRIAISRELAPSVRHIRAELVELKPDGSRQRVWSGAVKTLPETR